ncbi:hypothetical protein HDU67_002770 [Dinochytrium kinnereticum]|nr:hypothetical protein HDU67_002770 [Dinochytrium kinnereticum]
MVNPKGKASGMVIEDIVESDDEPQLEDGDGEDFDVDNMDFELPHELVGGSSEQPLLMTKAEAARAQRIPSSSLVKQKPQPEQTLPQRREVQANQLDPEIREAIKTWTSVYPVYLDAGKSTRKGRMISSAHAIKDPSIVFLGECCRRLGFSAAVENMKRHPKDPLTFGRVRVQIKSPSGVAIQKDVPNKKALLLKIAAKYPEVEQEMKKGDPMLATAAAASRSVMSKIVEESYKEATKEIKAKDGGGSSKKSKKKK